MINKKMLALGTKRSTIRELFEYGKQLAEKEGEENVFDFSLGNPSVEPPFSVNAGIKRIVDEYNPTSLHGYTSAEGDYNVRKKIADYIFDAHSFPASPEFIYMTVGAAAALTSVLKAIVCKNETVLVPSPYFPEYDVFTSAVGASLVSVATKDDFSLDVEAIENAIDETVSAIIINSPNNPSGAVYSANELADLAKVLNNAEKRYSHPIYLIADEPYRELVYDGVSVPFIPSIYKNTVVCYSFSKSLSIPGERIGYVFVSPDADAARDVYGAVCGAARSLGYVCAPSLLQRLCAECLGETADIAVYDKSRRTLSNALRSYGYEFSEPKGAFYLFVKALCPDANEFSETAKKFGLLLVPGDDFGKCGYVRIAYCQNPQMIERSLPAFKKLAEEFGYGEK